TQSRIIIPFGITGALVALSALAFLIIHLRHKYVPPAKSEPNVWHTIKWSGIVRRALGALMVAPLAGLQLLIYQLLPTFMQYSHLALDGTRSAQLMAIMNAANAICVAAGSALSLKYWSPNYIYANLALIIGANALLFAYESYRLGEPVLIVAALLMGSGLS